MAQPHRPCPALSQQGSCINRLKLSPDAPGSGYSQSTATPSRPYWLMRLTMLFTNVVRPVPLAAKASKAESSPLFHPPTEIDTLTLLAWLRDTSDESFDGLSTARSVPLPLGSTKA